MAGTTYNTLNLATAEEAPKANSTRKVAAVASVVAAVCVMFFAGRMVQGQTTPFSHDEVMNIAQTCEEGEFIGECVGCRDCSPFEYKNGGCSFFKDTFCSYCEPIANCQRENTVCTTRVNQKCSQCDCVDPVSSWDDISVEEAELTGSNKPSFSCYLNDQCQACSVCGKGSYQTVACNPAENQDTECAPCDTCDEGSYVAEKCTYFSNTKCEACNECDEGKMQTRMDKELDGVDGRCTGMEGANRNDIFTVGRDTVCKRCTACAGEGSERVSRECTPIQDTQCAPCTVCEDDSFVSSVCEDSKDRITFTDDLECAACTPLPLGTDNEPIFITTLCESDKLSDYQGEYCQVCDVNEYVETECFIGSKGILGSDTNCESCTPIPSCESADLRCDTSEDSVCSGNMEKMAKWGTSCNDNKLGLTCGWDQFTSGCEADNESYREREALRNGFRGTENNEFVIWCMKQCEAFPDCTAFEVDGCFFGDENCVQDDSMCSLKNHVDVEFGLGDEGKICYSRPVVV